MRVGFYQFRPQFGKVAANTRKIVAALDKVDAELIVLPELALSGYYFKNAEETLLLSEDPKRSNHIDSLINLCKKKNNYIVIGFAEKAKDKCFNSSALIGPKGIIHIYRKLHLFNEEKLCMSPGDTPLEVNEINGIKIGMMVCFDWAFPEVSRTLAIKGAEIICHPSNLVLNFCQQAMISRCLENRVYAITANRFGSDNRPHGTLRFTGKSQIVSPKGDLIFRAVSQREACYIADINPTESHDKFITKHNDLFLDRRPEYYKC